MSKQYNEDEEPMIKKGPNCWEYILYNTKIQIILVLILCAFIGIGTPFLWQLIWEIKPNTCAIERDLRYDCYPQRPKLHKNKTLCKHSGCCWDPDAKESEIQCFYPMITKNDKHSMPGYSIFHETDFSAELILAKEPYNLINGTNNTDFPNAPETQTNLKLSIGHYSADHFRIKIESRDSDPSDNIIPDFKPLVPTNSTVSNAVIRLKSKTNKNSERFSLIIERKESKETLFNTGDFSPFIYSDKFIEITTLLPNDYIYGLGQSPSRSFKHNMTYPDDWAVFNKQTLNLTMNQTSWFGSYPFYMGWTNEKPMQAYGVLLVNTNPIELITNSRPSLTFRTIGGNLEFHFFLGPTPKDVIKQLYALIGSPILPPYWALGFHMCRTDCDLTRATQVTQEMRKKEVPFESDCGSASYTTNIFQQHSPDTINDDLITKFYKNNYADKRKTLVVQVPQRVSRDKNVIKDWIEKLNGEDQVRYNNIIKIVEKWKILPSLKRKSEQHIGSFYNWCDRGNISKSVMFPSFTSTKIDDALVEELTGFGDYLDGVFLDYNTPLDLEYIKSKNMSKSCPAFIKDNLWNRYFYEELNQYTPCLDLVESSGDGDIGLNTLSTHNLYGHNHMKKTNQILKEIERNKNKNERKLVMSLSTFIGSGQLGGHIGTHMNASWDMLLQSHIQTLEFNMYGIPLTGFPVCGFKGTPPDEELCLRWYQLAALQPFMISHRDTNENLTDPISVSRSDTDGIALDSIKSAIVIRYRLLPYFYTQFYRAHVESEPPVRPMFYEFPYDEKTYKIDRQYFWGEALLVSPATLPKANSVEAYFPNGTWYDYYSGRRTALEKGQKLNISAIEHHINLHIRGGYIIPTQEDGMNTHESRKNNYTLIAALDMNRQAKGELFIDDGITSDTIKDEKYMLSVFTCNTNTYTGHFSIVLNHTKDDKWLKEMVEVQGYRPIVGVIKIFGIIDQLFPQQFNVSTDGDTPEILDHLNHYNYDSNKGVLTLSDLGLDLTIAKSYDISWEYRDWDKGSD